LIVNKKEKKKEAVKKEIEKNEAEAGKMILPFLGDGENTSKVFLFSSSKK
jgi:hypothetical protein